MIFNNVLELVGNTPMIKLNKLTDDYMAEVYLKIERNNPGGSIKDRAALGMIEEAEKSGVLSSKSIIVEPTSGNTGIALALIGRMKGYRVIIVMPDSFSVERRNMIKAYGAELVLTEGAKGMNGAIAKAEEMAQQNRNIFIPQQFMNPANANKHYATTAEEIINDLPGIDIFAAAVGSGGTIAGVGRRLKEYSEKIQIVGIEPERSPILSGGKPGAHKIQGIGAGFVPDIYDKGVVDKIITVSDEQAFETAKLLTREEGLLLGISSGANVYAALKLAKLAGKGKKIVTVAPDGGEKYLSTGLFD